MAFSKTSVISLLFLSYAVGGGGMIAMKLALESFAPIHIAFARVFFAAFFYLALFPKWRHIPYQKGDWKLLLGICLLDPGFFFLLQTSAMQYTSPVQGGALAASYPILTALMAGIFLKEKLSTRVKISICIAATGVLGNAFFAKSTNTAPAPLLGNSMVLLAMLASSGYAVCSRCAARRYSLLDISAIQSIGGLCLFLPPSLLVPLPQTCTQTSVLALLYLSIFAGLFLYLALNFALRHIKAGIVALFNNIIPLYTIFLSCIFLGERLTFIQTFFLALTLTGVILALSEHKD